MDASDRLIDLRPAMVETRLRLKKQLEACESGAFQLFWVKDGKRVDATQDQIEVLKRIIAEYDGLIDHVGSIDAPRP